MGARDRENRRGGRGAPGKGSVERVKGMSLEGKGLVERGLSGMARRRIEGGEKLSMSGKKRGCRSN